jgi:hypothetical protein
VALLVDWPCLYLPQFLLLTTEQLVAAAGEAALETGFMTVMAVASSTARLAVAEVVQAQPIHLVALVSAVVLKEHLVVAALVVSGNSTQQAPRVNIGAVLVEPGAIGVQEVVVAALVVASAGMVIQVVGVIQGGQAQAAAGPVEAQSPVIQTLHGLHLAPVLGVFHEH